MNSRFVKTDEIPFERCNVEEYSRMDINKFYNDALPKMARGKNETWQHFEKRRSRAEKMLNTFVFGRLYEKQFELKSIPSEYSDYQFSKHSEFGYSSSRGIVAGFSISIDDDEVLKYLTGECSDPQKMVRVERLKPNNTYNINKINVDAIGFPFNYWEIRQLLLNNTVYYVKSNCDKSGRIRVTKWITATGKSGRTKEIESLEEGCNLLWVKKQKYASLEISVLSPNGKEIGEINRKTDEDHLGDTEYREVFEPLLRNGCVDIESIKLHRLIPHNTPKGKPRKALVQVLITFHVKNLEEYEQFVALTKQDILSMRTLAAIDYNRKCDIIEGKIPDRLLSLEELFCDNEFPVRNPYATFDLLRSRDFLSGSTFTMAELEEFWSIYMPITVFCSLKERELPLIKDEKTQLFCKRRLFNYVLELTKDFTTGNKSIPRDLLKLSLYKNG